jgi:hypothetical protein
MFSKKTLILVMSLAPLGPIGAVSAYDSDGDGVGDLFDVCCATPQGTPVDEHGRPLGDLDLDCDVDIFDFAVFQTAFTGELSPCPPCGASNDCPGDAYCAKLLGECQIQGTCSSRPSECSSDWDPVCGCDGITYSNACLAALAGMSADHEGPCQPPGCQSNADCDASNYCAKGNGDCDGLGQCQPVPADCVPVWEPVCGCNGITYANICYAALDRVAVDYDGPCVPPSCQSNVECTGVGYCAKANNDCDGLGQCQPPPLACMPDWDPVCGCDGVTYDNACYAALDAENVDYSGECQASGCQTNADCDPKDYCAKDVGDSDGTGQCEARPAGCVPVGPTVCGCDGVEYDDSCYAALAGTSIAHEGPCGE